MKNWKRFNMRESKTATLYKPKPKLLQYRSKEASSAQGYVTGVARATGWRVLIFLSEIGNR